MQDKKRIFTGLMNWPWAWGNCRDLQPTEVEKFESY